MGSRTVSIVICTKNSERTLELTLKSVKVANPLEIIIVDGGSTDRTLEIARRFTNRVYHDKNRGLAYARYMGAKLARGEYVAYIDSDVEIISADYFKSLIEEMNTNGWIGIHAQVMTPVISNYWEEGMNFYFVNRFNIPGEKKELPMMACLIRRDAILEVGFDVRFRGAGEDQDFWRRAYERGYKFGVSSKISVLHYHRSSFKDFIKQRIWYGKGNLILFMKYHEWKKLFAPIGSIVGGFRLILKYRCFKYLLFFIVWGLSIGAGEVLEISTLILGREDP